MKEKTCRKCGCTDNDCRQCIEKTGSPCFWVEEDLCSACQPEVESITPKTPTMTFFKTLTALLTDSQKITIVVTRGNENNLTIGFLPEIKDATLAQQLPMLAIHGTPDEFDAGFFQQITPVLTKVEGLQSNLQQIEATEIKPSGKKVGKTTEETSDDDDDNAETAEKTKAKAKPASKKKPAPKPAKKEVKKEAKKPAPKKTTAPKHEDVKGATADEPTEIEETKKQHIKQMLPSELDAFITDIVKTYGEYPEGWYIESCLNFARAERDARQAKTQQVKPDTKPVQNALSFE